MGTISSVCWFLAGVGTAAGFRFSSTASFLLAGLEGSSSLKSPLLVGRGGSLRLSVLPIFLLVAFFAAMASSASFFFCVLMARRRLR